MKALVYTKPKEFSITDIKKPECGPRSGYNQSGIVRYMQNGRAYTQR